MPHIPPLSLPSLMHTHTHPHTQTAGWTPLMYASYVGHDTVVNLLLESGADTSLGTDSGLTALMVAAGCGNESICYFLLQVTPSLFPSLSPPFPPPSLSFLPCHY